MIEDPKDLRDKFALTAMVRLIDNINEHLRDVIGRSSTKSEIENVYARSLPESISKECYAFADAMMAARASKKEES